MIHARRRDSDTKRARVQTTLQQMLREGTPITFAAVARHAKVSSWLVYAPGIRETIGDARTRQQKTQGTPEPQPTSSIRDLQTDLALAHAEIKRLRTERAQHHHQLQLALGARMDTLAKADLLARIEELTRTNTELTAAAAQHRSDNQTLKARVTNLEDDLAAARTSLRRMIRANNLPPEGLMTPSTPGLHRKPEPLVRRRTGAHQPSPPRPFTQTIHRSSQSPGRRPS
jgi:chromosome segregation ATPase